MDRVGLGMKSGHTALRLSALLFAVLAFALSFGQGASLIKSIEVRGLVNINRELILASMRTKVGQPYAQAQLDGDKKAIEDLGFFQAVDVRAKEEDSTGWVVTVEVVEFPKIMEVRVVGNTVVDSDAVLAALATAPSVPIAAGNVYCLNSVPPAVSAIKNLYAASGYFGNVDAIGPLPESPQTINVVIVELTVNSISVQGNNRTKAGVLNKLIKTKPGEAFNRDKWQNDLRRMFNTQWFESIEPVVRESDDIGKIDIVVDVKEARTGLFNVGLQMDPRSNFAGLLRFSDSNFKGSGQSFSLNFLQGSEGGASVDFNYGNPYYDNRETSLNFSVYSRLVYRFTGSFGGSGPSPTSDRYFERHTGGSVSVSRPVKKQLYWSTGIRYEGIETSDIDPKAKGGFIQQDGTIGTLSTALILNRRDVDVDPSRGDWMRLQAEPGWTNITKVGGETPDPGLLGQHFYTRVHLEYRKYFTSQPPRERLDDPRRVIAVRARAGTITGTVPFFEQYFVGGSDSLRGYSEDRFWGKHMATLTLEYRHPVQKAFNAIVFVDYGGAWGGYGTVDEFTQSKGARFQYSYGLGLSFRTPLGPIRLDFGINQDGGSRTHFMIGTTF